MDQEVNNDLLAQIPEFLDKARSRMFELNREILDLDNLPDRDRFDAFENMVITEKYRENKIWDQVKKERNERFLVEE